MISVYSDGSVIKKNPSKIGGTWCFVAVENDKILCVKSGLVTPQDIGLSVVTNNYTELLAAVNGLVYFNEVVDWYTDSMVTLCRLTNGRSWNGIPDYLQVKALSCRSKINHAYLLGGHPTKKELECGKRRDGYPVSQYNVLADLECNKLAKQYMESKK